MTNLTIITDSAERARHQANVDAFLADKCNQAVFEAFADADFNEGPTDAELAYLVAEGLNISLSEAIDRLESVDADALRQEVLP